MTEARHQVLGSGSGLFKPYLTGFGLSVILTAISFLLVMKGAFSPLTTALCIFSAAVVQVLVQLRYFLHLDTSPDNHWNLMSFLFTVFIVILYVGGSLWIMYSFDYRM